MKKSYLFLILFALPGLVVAQGLTKTADGEGSVLFKGTNIGIDVGKTDFTFGANNLQKSIGKDRQFIFGANIKGENKDGLSTLFSQGDAVPSGTLHGFVGYSWSNATNSDHEAERKRILLDQEAYTNRFFADFKTQIYYATNSACRKPTQAKLKQDIKDALKVLQFIDDIATLIKPAAGDVPDVVNAKAAIQATYDSLVTENDRRTKAFEDRLATLRAHLAPVSYWQVMAFGFVDYSATQFKRLNALDSVNYTNSFQGVNVRGDKIGLGINLQWKNVMFGLTYDHASTSNFDILAKKSYTFKRTLTSGTQSLTEEKAITAYSGNYGTLKVNEIAADLIFNFKLDQEAKNHLLLDPYIRIQTSTNTTLLPNTLNLGCGFYFFQQTGKFLGGFYAELPDVNNNYEKMKPTADQQLKGPLQRLTFGLVGKLSLSSFLGIN